MQKSIVTFRGNVFIWRGPFEERALPRGASFNFHEDKKLWYTRSPTVAARLRAICDEAALKELNRKLLSIEPWPGELPLPPGEELYQFQKRAAVFALARNRSYLAMDPGLGKTPTAITTMNALARGNVDHFFVYISPPFLVENVADEFERWRTFPATVRILNKTKSFGFPELMIVPDSLLSIDTHQEEVAFYLRMARAAKKKIVFYVDEAHRFNNAESKRTKALLGYDRPHPKDEKKLYHVDGLLDCHDRITYLSGTPMQNRPIELFPILSHSAYETLDFMSRFDYGVRYCAGHDTGFGWDFNGASRIPELVKKVQPRFMLRMRKDLLNLPPKLEEMIVASYDMDPRLADLDASILNRLSPEDAIEKTVKDQAVADKILGEDDALHLSTYKRLLGEHKVRAAFEILSAILEETEETILVGGMHPAAILALSSHFVKYKPFVVTGATPKEDRLRFVKEFQASRDRRLFFGSIPAMGLGYTLTRANRVFLFEYSWNPADNDQFIDRAHRIGQKDTVLAQYLVFRNSLDKKVLEMNLRKRKTTKLM